MSIPSKETVPFRNYVSPVCEEVPMWTEGSLCINGSSNEHFEDEEGEW